VRVQGCCFSFSDRSFLTDPEKGEHAGSPLKNRNKQIPVGANLRVCPAFFRLATAQKGALGALFGTLHFPCDIREKRLLSLR
jgi:hypothetical protein